MMVTAWMASTGGQKGHVPPLSGRGQTEIVGVSCKNFCARYFSPSQFLIACSTPVYQLLFLAENRTSAACLGYRVYRPRHCRGSSSITGPGERATFCVINGTRWTEWSFTCHWSCQYTKNICPLPVMTSKTVNGSLQLVITNNWNC